jgi:hypothetical protein
MNRAAYRWVTFNGVRMQHYELARLAGLSPQTVAYRLGAGWTPERTVSTPTNRK